MENGAWIDRKRYSESECYAMGGGCKMVNRKGNSVNVSSQRAAATIGFKVFDEQNDSSKHEQEMALPKSMWCSSTRVMQRFSAQPSSP
jgi:hypothetical protein